MKDKNTGITSAQKKALDAASYSPADDAYYCRAEGGIRIQTINALVRKGCLFRRGRQNRFQLTPQGEIERSK